jgi:uncharacterized protein
MGKFIITKRSNGDFQFNLKASNHKIILTSEGYSSKAGCENGIDSVKENSQNANNFDKLISTNFQYYFNLKSTNGKIIGTSEMYDSVSSRDNGIDSVVINALDAEVEDETE